MENLEPRYEHKDSLLFWKVLAQHNAYWSLQDGLGFSYYYFVQHKIFKRWKKVVAFGYRPKDHPEYKNFCNKHLPPKTI